MKHLLTNDAKLQRHRYPQRFEDSNPLPRTSGCLSTSFLFADTFFEFPVVENYFTTRITVILTLEAFRWMNQHELKIFAIFKIIRVCLTKNGAGRFLLTRATRELIRNELPNMRPNCIIIIIIISHQSSIS